MNCCPEQSLHLEFSHDGSLTSSFPDVRDLPQSAHITINTEMHLGINCLMAESSFPSGKLEEVNKVPFECIPLLSELSALHRAS